MYTLQDLKERTTDKSFVANVKNTETQKIESVNEKYKKEHGTETMSYATMQKYLKDSYDVEIPTKNQMIPGFIDHGYREYKQPTYRGGLASAISRAQNRIEQEKAKRDAEMERE